MNEYYSRILPASSDIDAQVHYTGEGGLNHLPYLLSTSVSLAVIKDFSTIYMTALGLNQAYTLYVHR